MSRTSAKKCEVAITSLLLRNHTVELNRWFDVKTIEKLAKIQKVHVKSSYIDNN